ncbi:F-box/RNI-like superfamily protein, putative [Theobroma cacao]|uniref:F-box/RNI-like superfamily protein, putative n=1 Tax=Theobroma cacao TaxID=3641 RepID=A0A061DWZ5_THECC|nr:F-box/RNI-like superfamily protein, putative [Theobroma cacao]
MPESHMRADLGEDGDRVEELGIWVYLEMIISHLGFRILYFRADLYSMRMDSLPDAIVPDILSHLNNARDVAACKCVSKRWKESLPYLRSLHFPRNSFDSHSGSDNPDTIVWKMLSMIARLDSPSKLDCISAAKNLESLTLWGVLMVNPPKWDVFKSLQSLKIVGARLDGPAFSAALGACPNLTNLVLFGCEGVRSVTIELPYLEHCELEFGGLGDCSLSLTCPKIEHLKVQGCTWIRVHETTCLRNLSIASNAGRVYMVDFGKLSALEFLSMRGDQWCWDAICKMLEWSSEVKHLYMEVRFTGDSETHLPFPKVDFVEFFHSHPKLQNFDIHGGMFASLCQKNSLKNVEPGFVSPCLEEVVVQVRSTLNAEQKMSTLESLLKYGKNLKTMVISTRQMKRSHSSKDDFFDEIRRLRFLSRKIVRIE